MAGWELIAAGALIGGYGVWITTLPEWGGSAGNGAEVAGHPILKRGRPTVDWVKPKRSDCVGGALRAGFLCQDALMGSPLRHRYRARGCLAQQQARPRQWVELRGHI